MTTTSYRSLFDLTGRVAVVTGGAGGLGSEIGRGLADFGARVVLADLDRARARDVAGTIEGAMAEEVDVTALASVDALVARPVAALERVDILVNSAGIFHIAPAVEIAHTTGRLCCASISRARFS